MSIIRVGTNEKYSSGWAAAFGKGGKKADAAKATKPAAATPHSGPYSPSPMDYPSFPFSLALSPVHRSAQSPGPPTAPSMPPWVPLHWPP